MSDEKPPESWNPEPPPHGPPRRYQTWGSMLVWEVVGQILVPILLFLLVVWLASKGVSCRAFR